MPTFREALDFAKQQARGLVSPLRLDACPLCAGTCGAGFNQCAGCNALMRAGASRELLRRVLPLTTALDPGPWYTVMATYKTARPEHVFFPAAVLASSYEAFADSIAVAMGGAPDVVCITPSSRGLTLEQQRLHDVVRLAQEWLPPCEPLLTHVDGALKPNNTARPEVYTGDPSRVQGRRVLVVDDTWVSGASVTSAAMRLEQLGAACVGIVVIARRIERRSASYFTGSEEFVASVDETPWSPEAVRWPRPLIGL